MNQLNQLGKAKHLIKKLIGKPCWYIRCGEPAGSSFSLALGRKIKRKNKIDNKFLSKSYQENDPEYHLSVWCSWRLSKKNKVVVTSDDCENNYKWCKYLAKLMGTFITKVQVMNQFFDLKIIFSGGYRLDIFCDNGNKEIGPDSQWDLLAPNEILFSVDAGPPHKKRI